MKVISTPTTDKEIHTTNSMKNSHFEEKEFEDEFEIDEEAVDPLEDYNRFMTSINDSIFTNIFTPISNVYQAILYDKIRFGISNMFHNILFPIRVSNNLLQAKFENSFEETLRFTLNSTIGLLGFFDIAKFYYGLEKHNEDFGQTLGFYGVGPGIHIVLPILGPSNLRDSFSLVADSYMSPLSVYENSSIRIPNNFKQSFVLSGLYLTNTYSLHFEHYEALKEDSIDLYILLKHYYEQKRKQDIKD